MSIYHYTLSALALCFLASCGGGSASTTTPEAEAAPLSWDIYDHLTVKALVVAETVAPVIQYDFDNNSIKDVRDLSANKLDARFVGYDTKTGLGALTVGGYRGEALLFSEHGRLIVGDKKDQVNNAAAGDLTVSLWFSHSNISYEGNVRLVSKKTNWDDATGFEVEISAANNRIRVLGQGFEYVQAINVPIDYEWHHLVARINGDTGSIFIDGVDLTDPAKNTLPSIGVLGNSLEMSIGNHTSEAVPFQGAIDNFRFYDQAITDGDVQSLYTNEGKGKSLLAHWSFDPIVGESDGAGQGTAADQSVNGLDATTYDVLSYAGPDQLGNGIILDGISSYVACGGDKALAITGQCTINAWVKIDDNTADRFMRILSKKTEYEKDTGFELEYNPVRQRLSFTGSGTKVARANGVDLGLGEWHMVSAVVNGARVKFYIDGVAIDIYHHEDGSIMLNSLGQNTAFGEINPILQRDTEVVLGSSAMEKKKDKPKALLIGGLDEVRIYDYPLTIDEIIALIPVPAVLN